jgi:Outer membrane protein beta-barrel domain
MQNREFEKSVQQKMEELKLPPSAALWDKVEAALPAQKKPRRRLLIFWLLAAGLAGSLILKHYFYNSGTAAQQNASAAIETPVIAPAQPGKPAPPVKTKTASIQSGEENSGNPAATTAAGNSRQQSSIQTVIPAGKKYNRTHTAASAAGNEVYHTAESKKAHTKSATKVKVKAPGAVSDSGETTAETTGETVTANIAVAAAADTAMEVAVQKAAPQPKQDSLLQTAAKPAHKKQLAKKGWQFGLHAAAGTTVVKDGFFTGQPASYNTAYAAALNQAPPITSINNNTAPAVPTTGAAFAIGLAAQKQLAGRWAIVTGLHYLYQSTAMRVGQRVDSAVTVRYDANKSINPGSYYRTGNSKKYTNDFHLLELPLLLQYTISKKVPVYAEAGVTASYLLHSNALVYNAGNATYFTDGAVFNRLLVSASAGAGLRVLQKTNYPVSIGFQFRQGMGAVIKPGFGKQYFVNSLLYARIGFKNKLVR